VLICACTCDADGSRLNWSTLVWLKVVVGQRLVERVEQIEQEFCDSAADAVSSSSDDDGRS
jgi:hypothetical protein